MAVVGVGESGDYPIGEVGLVYSQDYWLEVAHQALYIWDVVMGGHVIRHINLDL